MTLAATALVEVYPSAAFKTRTEDGQWQPAWVVRVRRKGRHPQTHLHLNRQTAFATAQRIATRPTDQRRPTQEAA